MGVEKVIGFFLFATSGLIILVATIAFAFVTYRRRRERGFLLLLGALMCGFISRVLSIIFLGPGTFFPLDYSAQLWLGHVTWGLNSIAPLLALAGWILLARKRKDA